MKSRLKPLGKVKYQYDPNVDMWIVLDKECHVYTQGEGPFEMLLAYIDALRCMCVSLGKHYDKARRAGEKKK